MSEFKGYKVFVDDMRPIPPGWIGVRTVSEAIATLATLRPILAISLDHDILFPATRIDQYTPLMNETFKGVAYYIAAVPELRAVDDIRVHTSNAGAAKVMCDIMDLDFNVVYKRFDSRDYECANA